MFANDCDGHIRNLNRFFDDNNLENKISCSKQLDVKKINVMFFEKLGKFVSKKKYCKELRCDKQLWAHNYNHLLGNDRLIFFGLLKKQHCFKSNAYKLSGRNCDCSAKPVRLAVWILIKIIRVNLKFSQGTEFKWRAAPVVNVDEYTIFV